MRTAVLLELEFPIKFSRALNISCQCVSVCMCGGGGGARGDNCYIYKRELCRKAGKPPNRSKAFFFKLVSVDPTAEK